jgi:UMP-CMP kinase family protein
MSESGTKSELGYWNGKMAWDRADGHARRSPSISYSNSYKAWRIAKLDGHLAYDATTDAALPQVDRPWNVYKKGTPPAPTVTLFESEAAARASLGYPPADAPKNVVFVLGGPGAGKGTMCELAQQQLGWEHLSAGDLLRAERRAGGPNAELIESYIKAGKIVPVEITVRLLQEAMEKATWTGGRTNFLIDGFPRSLDNYDGWCEVMGGESESFMLFFECPLEVLEHRILKRAKYSGRSDDNIESLRKRFATYKNETMPIVRAFREKGACVEVDTSQPRPDVYALVKQSLSKHTDADKAGAPLTERAEMLLGLRPYPKKKKKKTKKEPAGIEKEELSPSQPSKI